MSKDSAERPANLRRNLVQSKSPIGENSQINLNMNEVQLEFIIKRKQQTYSKAHKQQPRRIQRPPPVPMRLPDTNCIYPPDQEYHRKNESMKSPQKKRPKSGEPSPDKNQIKIDDNEEEKCRILAQFYDAKKLLEAAKNGIRETRLKVAEQIEKDTKKIQEYKQRIRDVERIQEEKVTKILKDNFYVENTIRTLETKADEAVEEKTHKKVINFKKKKDPTEYKWAFGQKIPVDGDWINQQRPAEIREKDWKKEKENLLLGKKSQSTTRKSLNFMSDKNGRLLKENTETATAIK